MFYDSHTHTLNSDGRNTVDEMCDTAIKKGIFGISITDHADMNFFFERNTLEKINKSIADIEAAKCMFGDQLKIFSGVELGEYLYNPILAKKVLSSNEFDTILCSVHYLPDGKWSVPYNRVNFATEGTDEENHQYIDQYFDLLLKTVSAFDFNVLAHIICPARYMTHKYGRITDIMKCKDKICLILKEIIKKQAALELNSIGLNTKPYAKQYEEVLRLYRELGGRLITIGSDAHSAEGIAVNFDLAKQILESCGFTSYCYFEKKEPITIKL